MDIASRAFDAYYRQNISRSSPSGAAALTIGSSTEFSAFIQEPNFAFEMVEGKTEDALEVCQRYSGVLDRLVSDYKAGRP